MPTQRKRRPGLLARHRRAARRHVDQLQSAQVDVDQRRVVDLDEFVRRARAAGHHLAYEQSVRGGPGDSRCTCRRPSQNDSRKQPR